MGRKKGTEREEENFEITKQGGGGGGKLKKKNRAVIDDDEYSVGTELSEEPTVQDETVVHAFGKKKGKKGNKSGAKDDDDEMDEKPTKQGGGGGGGKSRKKNVVVDDDEYNIGIRTPICIPQKDFIDIGRLASIENIHRHVDYVKKGQRVDVKIVGSNSEEQQKMFGMYFEMEDELVSKVSRRSIDILKDNFRGPLN